MSNNNNQIHDSLMRIKQNQAKLLTQLRSQHDSLQGYLNTAQFPASGSQGSPIGKQLRHNSDENAGISSMNSPSLASTPSFQPYFTFNSTKSTSSTQHQGPGSEQVLEYKNKKIEELLFKQRKIYEQNHILQQQNESLNEDYRQLKKMYYQIKQAIAQSAKIVEFMMGEVVAAMLKHIVQAGWDLDIGDRAASKWQKFAVDNPQIFASTHCLQPLTSACTTSLSRMMNLVSSSERNPSPEQVLQQKQSEIVQLKQKVTNLLSMNLEISKNREQAKNLQKTRIEELEEQKFQLTDKLRKIEKEKLEIEQRQISKLRNWEHQILGYEREVRKMATQRAEIDAEVAKLRGKLDRSARELEIATQNQEELTRQLKHIRQQLKQKQQQYTTQIQLSKRQNILLQKLTQDLQISQSRPSPSPTCSSLPTPQLLLENESLRRELQALQSDYNRYRESSKKQNQSLMGHLKEVKNQHLELIKSQENARSSQMRYRELVAVKGSQIKMGTNVEHLWAVKEIEYDNLSRVFADIKGIANLSPNLANLNNIGYIGNSNNLGAENDGARRVVTEGNMDMNPQLTGSGKSNPSIITLNAIPSPTHINNFVKMGNEALTQLVHQPLPPVPPQVIIPQQIIQPFPQVHPIGSQSAKPLSVPLTQPIQFRHIVGRQVAPARSFSPSPNQLPLRSSFGKTSIVTEQPQFINGGSAVYVGLPNSTMPLPQHTSYYGGNPMEIRTI